MLYRLQISWRVLFLCFILLFSLNSIFPRFLLELGIAVKMIVWWYWCYLLLFYLVDFAHLHSVLIIIIQLKTLHSFSFLIHILLHSKSLMCIYVEKKTLKVNGSGDNKTKITSCSIHRYFFYHVTIILANGNNGIPCFQPHSIEVENCLE